MKDEKLIDSINDEYAMRLFNKREFELGIAERQLLQDFIDTTRGMTSDELDSCVNMISDPIWKENSRFYIDICSDGIHIRDSRTKEPVKTILLPTGYLAARCVIRGSFRTELVSIHRLVAQEFVYNPDPENKTVVHHIDKVKTHNFPWNLMWLTVPDHATIHGIDVPCGENHYRAIYSNSQVEQACQLLQDHPDWSLEKISKETGVNVEAVGAISCRSNWKSISNAYNFSHRQTFNYNSDDQIRKVCELLRDHPEMTYEDISENTGVLRETVGYIYQGRQWTRISKDYIPFPPRATRDYVSDDQVRNVCKLLSDRKDLTYQDIEDMTGVDSQVVGRIYRRDAWTEISKDYEFINRDDVRKGENNPASTHSDDQIRKICELKNEVYIGHIKMDRKQIADAVGVGLSLVKHVIAGETRTDISSQYDWYQAKHK